MNSPKSRILDVKVMLSKCATIDDPVLLKDALLECIKNLDNIDIPIVKAVEQLKTLYKHIQLNIEVNTNVTISKELLEFIKNQITDLPESPVSLTFNSDDCLFNGISVIDSINLINEVKETNLKVILVVDDSLFSLKMLFNRLKELLFVEYKGKTPDFKDNYETFEINGYMFVFCKNGKIAINTFNVKQPFAIVTDNDMPFMDGYTMSKTILAKDELTKILMVSGNSSTSVDDLLTIYQNRFKFTSKCASKKTFHEVFTEMFLNTNTNH